MNDTVIKELHRHIKWQDADMKKNFEEPKLIIIQFDDSNVIATSSPGPGWHYDPELDEWVLD